MPDGTSTPTPTNAVPSPASVEEDPIRSAILAVRAEGNAKELIGTAVAISSDGYLITPRENTSGRIEIVLPDGQAYRPAIVAIEAESDLALLKVPASGLNSIRFSNDALSPGTHVITSGIDRTSGDLGQMGGEITTVTSPPGESAPWESASVSFTTDVSFVQGFSGAMLVDSSGRIAGIAIEGEDDDGRRVVSGISHEWIRAWLQHRDRVQSEIATEARDWPIIELAFGWSLAYPDNWNVSSSGENTDFRAEITPGDPDAPLEFSISVDENPVGNDAEQFVDEHFADRANAIVWGIDRSGNLPRVRVVVQQEGAMHDVAYILADDYLIAVSLTSGYIPETDGAQAERARALFEAVIQTLQQSNAT